MMGWYGDGWGSGYSMLLMLLLWAVVIGLGIWAVARLTRSNTSQGTLESPRQILDRRLASGEINGQQYAEARRLVENAPPPVDQRRY